MTKVVHAEAVVMLAAVDLESERASRYFRISAPKPRNQLTTRESPAFLRLRRALFDFIREGEA